MTHEEEQKETARQLGYGDDVSAMNAEHDPLHRDLCKWLGIHSYAMDVADGLPLNHEQYTLANWEEDAVLAVQRLRQMHRNHWRT